MTLTPVLFTTDLATTVAFYTERLGFVLELLWPAEAPSLCTLVRGESSIMFHTDRWDDEQDAQLTGQLRIDVEDGLVLHAALREPPRVEVLWGPEVYGYGRREFSIRDRNGYRLVLSEPTDEPATCPG